MAKNGTNGTNGTFPYNYAKVFNSGNSYVYVDQEAIAAALANALSHSRQNQHRTQWFY